MSERTSTSSKTTSEYAEEFDDAFLHFFEHGGKGSLCGLPGFGVQKVWEDYNRLSPEWLLRLMRNDSLVNSVMYRSAILELSFEDALLRVIEAQQRDREYLKNLIMENARLSTKVTLPHDL